MSPSKMLVQTKDDAIILTFNEPIVEGNQDYMTAFLPGWDVDLRDAALGQKPTNFVCSIGRNQYCSTLQITRDQIVIHGEPFINQDDLLANAMDLAEKIFLTS